MISSAGLLVFLLVYHCGLVVARAALERQGQEDSGVSILWQWLPAAFWWGGAVGLDQLRPYLGTLTIGGTHLLLSLAAIRQIRILRRPG